MKHTDWEEKWKHQDIAFHRTQFHPKLTQYYSNPSRGKVLVPLCGKSLDLLWLCQQGYSVVGVELSAIACRAFFSENKILFTETNFCNYQIFKSDQIVLWCGDFFTLPQEAWEGVTSVYDRAALVALPQADRRKYAHLICDRVRGQRTQNKQPLQFTILLISLEYPQDAFQGPPFAVTLQEIQMLYSPLFKINPVCIENDDAYFKNHPTLKAVQVTETTYRLET